MANSFGRAIAEGIVPLPHNRPKKLTIEYAQGQVIMLKGAALLAFWEQYIEQYALWERIMAGPPPIPSEQIQNAFTKQKATVKKPTEE